MSPSDRIWERVSRGQHVAALGFTVLEPPRAMHVIRVSCDVPRTTLGPIAQALEKVERAQGAQPEIDGHTGMAVSAGLRRQLLGDLPSRGPDAALVEACNRLARRGRTVGLIFEALDAADEATCRSLQRIIERPGWLELPLVVVLRQRQPRGACLGVIEALRQACGDDAVTVNDAAGDPVIRRTRFAAGERLPDADASGGPDLGPDLRSIPPGSPGRPDTPAFRDDALAGDGAGAAERAFGAVPLPRDVMRVLRAGAVIGSGFEAELLARLLDVPVLDILDCLQRAADMGVPVEDRGELRFFLPEAVLAGLRDSLLPSLRATWHRRLGELLSGHEVPGEPVLAPEQVVYESAGAADGAADDDAGADAGAAAMPSRGEPAHPAYDDMFDVEVEVAGETDAAGIDSGELERAEDEPADFAAPRPVDEVDEMRSQIRGGAPWVQMPEPAAARLRRDEARAAEHLSAAGELEQAAQRYAQAAVEASTLGAYSQAMAHGQRALHMIERLPDSPARRHFRIELLVALGRLQWQAASTHSEVKPDPTFTLQSARATAAGAQSLLVDDDPPELIAQVSTLMAGVCYDLGDLRSLERALDELTRASRLLLDSGNAIAAARLLNDQAAVYVRLGDPVRASHLLSRSRSIFEARSGGDPVTVEELAETHHLLAKLPLSARIRPGREADAYSMALDHARVAEDNYRELGKSREIGRVWETIGRIELARGNLERAIERLSATLELQSRTGDITGLARSAAALSSVLAMTGKLGQALALLGDSIILNREKGSPIGLAFNRRAYDELCSELAEDAPEGSELMARATEIGQRLESAEAIIGRIPVPGLPPNVA